MRGYADTAKVDVVEVAQRDAVEHQQLRADAPVLLEDRSQGLRDVAVEDHKDRLSRLNGAGKAHGYGARERGEPLERRRAAPAEGERDFGFTFHDIERLEVGRNGPGDLVRVDALVERDRRLQHLEIPARQQLAGLRDIHRVARELHAVLGGAERGGADALAGRQYFPRQFTETFSKGEAKAPPQVAKIALLAPVDVLGDPAREHDAVDAREVADGFSEVGLVFCVENRIAQHLSHEFGEPVERTGRHAVAKFQIG